MSSLHTAAATYADNSVHIFPVTPGGKTPLAGVKWRDESTTDPTQIDVWWTATPDANIGIDLAKTGCWALDVDGPDAKQFLEELETDYNQPLPDTYQVVTGRAEGSGRHWIFHQPETGEPVRNTKIGRHLETRGAGGYVVAPPSIHPSGRPYLAFGRWASIVSAPDWLVALARKPAAPTSPTSSDFTRPQTPGHDQRRLDGLAGKVAMADLGNRSDVLNWAAYQAGRAVAAGTLDRGGVEQRLTDAATRSGHAADDGPQAIAATIASGIDSGIGEGPDTTPTPTASYTATTAVTLTPTSDPTRPDPDSPAGNLDAYWADPTIQQMVTDETARILTRQRAHELVVQLEAETSRPPQLHHLPDFLAQPDPDVTYRIDKLWPQGGRVLLAAQYKAGKTTMVGNILRSLVDGTPFLGSYDVDPLPDDKNVVLIDDELHPDTLRRWLRDQQIVNVDRIHVVPLRGNISTFHIIDDTVRDHWAQLLVERDAGIVILDCLRPIIDSAGLSEDKDAGKVLTAFDDLCGAAGVDEALIVHHMGHQSERSRGDSRLRDWPDAEWRIIRDGQDSDGDADPDAQRFFAAFGRDVAESEQLLAMSTDGRQLTVAGGGRRQEGEAKVLGVLLEAVESDPGIPWRALRGRVGAETKARHKDVDDARDRALDLVLIQRRQEGQTHRHYITAKGRRAMKDGVSALWDTPQPTTLETSPQTPTGTVSPNRDTVGHGDPVPVDNPDTGAAFNASRGVSEKRDTVGHADTLGGVSRAFKGHGHHPAQPCPDQNAQSYPHPPDDTDKNHPREINL